MIETYRDWRQDSPYLLLSGRVKARQPVIDWLSIVTPWSFCGAIKLDPCFAAKATAPHIGVQSTANFLFLPSHLMIRTRHLTQDVTSIEAHPCRHVSDDCRHCCVCALRTTGGKSCEHDPIEKRTPPFWASNLPIAGYARWGNTRY